MKDTPRPFTVSAMIAFGASVTLARDAKVLAMAATS
jgi:hypothetical protein